MVPLVLPLVLPDGGVGLVGQRFELAEACRRTTASRSCRRPGSAGLAAAVDVGLRGGDDGARGRDVVGAYGEECYRMPCRRTGRRLLWHCRVVGHLGPVRPESVWYTITI